VDRLGRRRWSEPAAARAEGRRRLLRLVVGVLGCEVGLGHARVVRRVRLRQAQDSRGRSRRRRVRVVLRQRLRLGHHRRRRLHWHRHRHWRTHGALLVRVRIRLGLGRVRKWLGRLMVLEGFGGPRGDGRGLELAVVVAVVKRLGRVRGEFDVALPLCARAAVAVGGEQLLGGDEVGVVDGRRRRRESDG
jgi:hypothetical protein